MTSYGLSDVVLYSGGAYMTSQSVHVVRSVIQKGSQLYKVKSDMFRTIVYGLSMSSPITLSIFALHLINIFLFFSLPDDFFKGIASLESRFVLISCIRPIVVDRVI